MKKKKIWIIPVLVIMAFVFAFLIYTENYYHADETAITALDSDEAVFVSQTGYGWFFDGPSEENVLVFYPGGKVEETAYAPLLHRLAQRGMDVCLLKAPFRLALFSVNKAEEVLKLYSYPNRYVGGHSLGGAMASMYASGHGDELTGVILLAAYPARPLDQHLRVLAIYGSEDGILNLEKVADGRQYVPGLYTVEVIKGGNHAQFGNYGVQKGDGTASVSSEDQQKQTVDLITQYAPYASESMST